MTQGSMSYVLRALGRLIGGDVIGAGSVRRGWLWFAEVEAGRPAAVATVQVGEDGGSEGSEEWPIREHTLQGGQMCHLYSVPWEQTSGWWRPGHLGTLPSPGKSGSL